MLIDSNIFLEFLLKQEKSDKCRILLNKTIKGEINAFVSNFAIDSIILAMIREKINVQEITKFLYKLANSKGISIHSITIKDRVGALSFMNKYGLDYEDALQLQAAISTNSKEIVSFDNHFDNIQEIKRVEP